MRAKPSPKLGTGEVDAEWMASHADFHAALISACGSPRLLALHDQLFEQSERYRSLLAYLKTNRHVADEHAGIWVPMRPGAASVPRWYLARTKLFDGAGTITTIHGIYRIEQRSPDGSLCLARHEAKP